METDKIVEQVAALVRQKLAAESTIPISTPVIAKQPGLVLYEESACCVPHCGNCKVCAGADCPADISEYKTIVLASLSCRALYRIANGAPEAAFEKAAVSALLTSKKIMIVKEGAELLRYIHTAPPLYYKNLYKNLEILLGSGAHLVSQDKLCEAIKSDGCCTEAVPKGAVFSLSHKMLSVKDVKDAQVKGYSGIQTAKDTIVSALAADYAKEHGFRIIR